MTAHGHRCAVSVILNELPKESRDIVHNQITSVASRLGAKQQNALETGMQLMEDDIHRKPEQVVGSSVRQRGVCWGMSYSGGPALLKTVETYEPGRAEVYVKVFQDIAKLDPIIGVAGVLYPVATVLQYTEDDFILQKSATSLYKISVEDDKYSNISKYIGYANTRNTANVHLVWCASGKLGMYVASRDLRKGEMLRRDAGYIRPSS